MERIEKPLVPEWLKVGNGGLSGGPAHHLSVSSTQSDQISSSYFHRSSSSNVTMMHDKDASGNSHPYISFGGSRRERDREENLGFWSVSHGVSDSFMIPTKKRNGLSRYSQSMVSGKRSEVGPRRMGNDPTIGGKIMGNIQKSAFEREFPSLMTEEKQGVQDTGRVLSQSHSLSSTSQSRLIGGEGWTSVLAQLPSTAGSNDIQSTTPHTAPAVSACVSAAVTTGLNMAETVAQAPARSHTKPQLSIEVQRFEELAIKQSRQLIPMTPSLPKSSAINFSEKLKSKTVRSSEMISVTKVGQQPPIRGNTRPDISKTAPGKLTMLSAAREKSDDSPPARDGHCLTNLSRVLPAMVSSPTFTLRDLANPRLSTDSRAPASFAPKDSIDKRPLSQSQDRIDFFNSIRKKSSANHMAGVSYSTSALPEKSTDQITGMPAVVNFKSPAPGSSLDSSPSNGRNIASNEDANEDSKIDLSLYARFPEKEELALLWSMGWEENAEESNPIMEEEISAFYESLKLMPHSRLYHGGKLVKFLPFGSHVCNLSSASSAWCSYNT